MFSVSTAHRWCTRAAALFAVTLAGCGSEGSSETPTSGNGGSVNLPPAAAVSATPQSGAAPLTVILDGTSSTDIDGTIFDYAWELGDGTILSGQSVQHTYTNPGVYTATLTVTDDAGESSAASTSVQVETAAFGPVIVSQPTDVTVAQGQTATFEVEADGLPAPTYQWFLDGVPIPGARGALVALSGVTLADTGSEVLVEVSGHGGTVASSTAFLIVVPESEASWWTSSLSKRLPITVSSESAVLDDRVASVDVDLLSALGGAPLDPTQLRLVEYDDSGDVIDPAVPFQFDPAAGFDAFTNPSGTVSILMTGDTPASTERSYHLYFAASSAATFNPPPVLPLVAPVVLVPDEGQLSYEIATPSGTWFYQLEGGGFSSLEDPNGNDWISYQPGGGSAGEFRGIPNLVYPEGHFHPGATSSQTTLLHQGPVKTTFESETTDGWRMVWDVYPSWATATVLDAPKNYWFLYEGTPGGAVEPNADTVTRSGGVTTLLSQSWKEDLPGPEWVYFADPAQARALFVATHEDDAWTDSYRTMNGEMTVFGFGRDGLRRTLSGTPRTFSVGLSDGAGVEDAIASATASLVVQTSAPQSRPDDPNATTAAIAPGVTIGRVPLTVAFDGGGSIDPGGSIVSYAWDFGDGTTGSGPNPNHVYSAPGTYEITLTVTDVDGAMVEDRTSLVVAPSASPP